MTTKRNNFWYEKGAVVSHLADIWYVALVPILYVEISSKVRKKTAESNLTTLVEKISYCDYVTRVPPTYQ